MSAVEPPESNGQSAAVHNNGELAHIDPTAGPRNKLVRDLWWMMASPGMLRETDATSAARPLHDAVGASIVGASRGWLARLDEDPSELEAYLAAPSRRSTRLGFYAQSLVEFWIERCPALRTTQLRCGQQLRRGQRGVVGSLKYVFCCAPTDRAVRAALGCDPPGTAPAPGRRCLLHWELSIKFFVYVAPPQGALPAGAAARYVGPFLHENLDARVATSARKLRLSAEADVRKWATRTLAKVEQDDRCLDLRAHSALRGFVFYDRAAPESSVLSVDHAKGWVARDINGVREAVPTDTTHFVILPKSHWLAPCRLPKTENGYLLPACELVGAPEPLRAVAAAHLAAELARLAERCPATPIMVASLRPFDEDALYETSRGFLLPDEWDPAPLLRGATTWKKHKRKPPSLDADGRVVEVNGFPSPAHPSVAGLRVRGAFRDASDAAQEAVCLDDDALLVDDGAVETGAQLVKRLEGRPHEHARNGRRVGSALLAERARAVLTASRDSSQGRAALVVDALGALAVVKPRSVGAKIGAAILAAADPDPSSAAPAGALLRRALKEGRNGPDLALAVEAAARFGAERPCAADVVREALGADSPRRLADSPRRLELAARYVILVGRPPVLTSAIVADACVALAKNDAMEAAARLCEAPLAGDDAGDDAVAVDAVAAAALVAAAEDLGHRRAARRLRRRLFGDAADEDVTTPLAPREHALVLGCPRSATDGACLAFPDIAVRDVSDAQGAAAMAAALGCEPIIAVDAEWPPGTAAATLLQVATPQTVYLVDLAALDGDAAAVVYAAVAGARAVLAYGFASDATRLRRAAPAAPDPATWRIRDLKRSEAGLAAVCATRLGTRLDKAEQRSDWGRRPLSPAQRAYAALDAHVLLQVAATYPFPAALGPDDVAALAATGHVLSDGDIDFSVVVRCKTLALLGGGERRMAVLPAGERLSLAADETLAPAGELVALFGLPRGALGPVGAHRAAEVRVARCLAGRKIALGCGEVGQSLVADAEALVSCLGGRAVLF